VSKKDVELYDPDQVAQRIYHLRQVGMDWAEIQDDLVKNNYMHIKPPIDQLRAMLRRFVISMASYIGPDEREVILGVELALLGQMQKGLYNAAITGDTKAVETMLKIMATRAKYTGLDQLSTQDKTTLATVLVVGGDQAAFMEALEHGRSLIMGGVLPDDDDDQEGAHA
jgi:hypothetical protein